MAQHLEKEIAAKEDELSAASRTVDVDGLDRLYADDIVMTNVLGETCGKGALMDEARRGAAQRQANAGKPFTSSYDKEDLRIVALGDHAAVTSYRFIVRMKGEGIDVNRRYRTTNVWAKRDGRWQVVAAQTAFVLAPTQVARLAAEQA